MVSSQNGSYVLLPLDKRENNPIDITEYSYFNRSSITLLDEVEDTYLAQTYRPTRTRVNEVDESYLAQNDEATATLIDKAEETCQPQIDGGKSAWMFMVGAMIIDAVIWGFPLNFGVFQNYYASHEPFMGNNYISMIGTFATGIAYLGGPLMTPVTIRLHRYRQYLVLFGSGLCIAGNVGGSFTSDARVLIFCQGVLYGTGFLIISYCTFSMLNEWFVKRRGFAYGVLLSAAGLSGLVLPFVLQALLDRYGYAITLRIYALSTVVIVAPAVLLLRTPARNATVTSYEENIDYSALRKPIFTSLSICNFLQGLVFYLPGIFLPSYATALSLSATNSVVILAVLNLTSVLGTLVFGYLSDFIDIHILLGVACFGSSITAFTLWGLGKSMLDMCLFAICYGFLAGSFESLFPRFATAMTDDANAELTFYGFFEFERGLGMVLAGPISSILIQKVADGTGYGMGKYMGVVLFVGSALFVSSWSGLGWFVRRKSWYK